nr:hypothetical protein CFP56_16627 [Quercus suber]
MSAIQTTNNLWWMTPLQAFAAIGTAANFDAPDHADAAAAHGPRAPRRPADRLPAAQLGEVLPPDQRRLHPRRPRPHRHRLPAPHLQPRRRREVPPPRRRHRPRRRHHRLRPRHHGPPQPPHRRPRREAPGRRRRRERRGRLPRAPGQVEDVESGTRRAHAQQRRRERVRPAARRQRRAAMKDRGNLAQGNGIWGVFLGRADGIRWSSRHGRRPARSVTKPLALAEWKNLLLLSPDRADDLLLSWRKRGPGSGLSHHDLLGIVNRESRIALVHELSMSTGPPSREDGHRESERERERIPQASRPRSRDRKTPGPSTTPADHEHHGNPPGFPKRGRATTPSSASPPRHCPPDRNVRQDPPRPSALTCAMELPRSAGGAAPGCPDSFKNLLGHGRAGDAARVAGSNGFAVLFAGHQHEAAGCPSGERNLKSSPRALRGEERRLCVSGVRSRAVRWPVSRSIRPAIRPSLGASVSPSLTPPVVPSVHQPTDQPARHETIEYSIQRPVKRPCRSRPLFIQQQKKKKSEGLTWRISTVCTPASLAPWENPSASAVCSARGARSTPTEHLAFRRHIYVQAIRFCLLTNN